MPLFIPRYYALSLFLFAILSSVLCYSQSTKTDIDDRGTVIERIDSLREAYKKYLANNSKLALEMANKAMLNSDDIDYFSGSILTRIDLSFIHNVSGEFEPALKYAFDALNKFKLLTAEQDMDKSTHENEILLARVYGNIGDMYKSLDYLPLALKYYNKADPILKRNEMEGLSAQLQMTKASLYRVINEYDEAKVLYFEAIGTFKSLDNTSMVAHCHGNLSNVYADLEEFDLAYQYLDSALQFYRKGNNKAVLANTLNNKASVLFDEQKYQEALEPLDEALEILNQIDTKKIKSVNQSIRGAIYLKLGQLDKSEELLEKELSNARALLYNDTAEEICQNLIKLYKLKNDTGNEVKYKSILLDIKTTKEENEDKKSILEEQYAKKFDEQADLFDFREAIYKKSNTIIMVVVGFIVMQIIILMTLYARKEPTSRSGV